MRTLACILMVVGLACVVLAQNGQALPGDESMVLYLPLDEEKGDPKDLSQYEHEVTLLGKPESVEGVYGNAREFDGTKFIKVPITDVLQLRENLTVEFWSRREVDQPMPKWNTMIETYSGQAPSGLWRVLLHAASRFRLDVCSSPDCAVQACDVYSIYPLPEEWTHVAVVYDLTSAIIIYFNGEEDNRSKCAHVMLNELDVGISIGGFNGAMDDIVLYNRALSPEEIKKDMKSVLAVSASGKLPAAWGSIKTSY